MGTKFSLKVTQNFINPAKILNNVNHFAHLTIMTQ